MSKSRPFLAQPYLETRSVSPSRPVVSPQIVSPKARAVNVILTSLRDLEAPFVTPADIAAYLELTPNAMRYHCRNCRALKNWAGSYRFFLDDAGHVAALRALVSLSVHSVKALPASLRLH